MVIDPVLEHLLVEGTFDRHPPSPPDWSEELCMQHSAAMVQRLLMWIEVLENDVSLFSGYYQDWWLMWFLGSESFFISAFSGDAGLIPSVQES